MPLVDVMIPVYNEEKSLEHSILHLRHHLSQLDNVPATFEIVIVDNASTDDTRQVGEKLQRDHAGIRYLRLPRKGRGYALKTAWDVSEAAIFAYMDVDLSTSLDHIPALLLPLLAGERDIAIGSRLSDTSKVAKRSPLREILSRGYNFLLKFFMAANFVDAQCGFKAVTRDAWQALSADIQDSEWFFDTELLLLAQYRGYRIETVPVVWIDDPDSRVKIVDTVKKDLLGMFRIYRSQHPYSSFHRLFTFGLVGGATTVLYAGMIYLFGLLTQDQTFDYVANLITLIVTTVVNVALNRRYTYRRNGREDVHKHYFAGLAAFFIFLIITSAGIGLIHLIAPNLSNGVQALATTGLSLIATVVKYIVFSLGFRENAKEAEADAVLKVKDTIKDVL